MDATIVIPVKNGGKLLKEVLDMVFAQETSFSYEVICVDSGSTDESLSVLKQYLCTISEISAKDFGHGKTRNYGASLGTGEFILFLTQDAKPADTHWLQNFISAMKEDDRIAGGFGRHLAYPECNPLDQRDLPNHFRNFGEGNTVFELEDRNRYDRDLAYRMYLGFFSDNNSCLRRSIWELYPYEDVNFAEDQRWARTIIEAGYKKLYCADAVVYHSHNYDPDTFFKRYYDEYKGLYNVYGWVPYMTRAEAREAAKQADQADIAYLKGLGLPDESKWIQYAKKRNKARCMGAFYGTHYFEYPVIWRDKLDKRISQQYEQIGIASTREYTKEEKKDYLKWLLTGRSVEYLTFNQVVPMDAADTATQTVSAQKIPIVQNYQFVTDSAKKFPFVREDYEAHKGQPISVTWVMPAPGKGSGGHTTLSRFITGLQKRGIQNKIVLLNAAPFTSDEECKNAMIEWYGMDFTGVEVHINFDDMSYTDAVVATSWQSAYAVNRWENCVSRFYFVQDFEPYFYPIGSDYALAENTYKFGFRGITASPYLAKRMAEYGMEAEPFCFSYDKDLYKPSGKKHDGKRIFFYARPFTGRRAFELGLLTLNEVCKRMPEVAITMAGDNLDKYEIPFNYRSYGIVPPSKLAELYSESNMCLVYSGTNISLAPLEIMGCGSVCVSNGGENNEWLLDDTNSIVIDWDPIKAAEKMVYYLQHEDELEKIRLAGMEYAANTSWDKEVDKVYDYVVSVVEKDKRNV